MTSSAICDQRERDVRCRYPLATIRCRMASSASCTIHNRRLRCNSLPVSGGSSRPEEAQPPASSGSRSRRAGSRQSRRRPRGMAERQRGATSGRPAARSRHPRPPRAATQGRVAPFFISTFVTRLRFVFISPPSLLRTEEKRPRQKLCGGLRGLLFTSTTGCIKCLPPLAWLMICPKPHDSSSTQLPTRQRSPSSQCRM